MNKKNQIRIIQASAGSGKTYTLTEEVYKAIKTGIARPGSLLVTTFTKKAAAELTGKVTAKLVAEGMREAANEIRQAYIGTVNSVCARLLREYAFERGLSFRQQVLDEDEEKRLYTEALSRTFSKDQAGITLEKDIGDVCQRLDLGNWRELVSSIAQASRLNRVAPSDLEQWAQTSQKLLFKGITLGIDQHPELVKETKLAADRLAELITTGEDTTKKTAKARQTLQQFLAVCSRAGPVQWKEYVALAGLSAGLKSGANGLLDKVRSLAGTHYQWPGFKKDLQSCIRLLYTAAARSLYGFAELKARSGWVDFVDQEVLCLEALGSSQVQQSLSERLDMVFVDEFQDTSPIQLSLFLKLASLAKASVWVGDPKQSIYGFRDTDPDLMLAALSRLIKGAPETILDRSFRSRPELVTFVNHSFKDTFHAQDLEPAQVVLKPERQDRIKFPALESWVLDKQVLDGRPQQNKNSDTQALALQVKRLLDQPDQHYPGRRYCHPGPDQRYLPGSGSTPEQLRGPGRGGHCRAPAGTRGHIMHCGTASDR
jgi:ATP-dependent exoDNAse (exonuclease V) beta subunit